ncbi:MAG: hypothetical protein ACXU8R_08990, partial [Xanthobacteraceae bacterium]
MIDDDWAFTELEEIEPADDEDTEVLVAVATFCVIVMASMASLLLLATPMLIPTPGVVFGRSATSVQTRSLGNRHSLQFFLDEDDVFIAAP